jgi:hypothetical protein
MQCGYLQGFTVIILNKIFWKNPASEIVRWCQIASSDVCDNLMSLTVFHKKEMFNKFYFSILLGRYQKCKAELWEVREKFQAVKTAN